MTSLVELTEDWAFWDDEGFTLNSELQTLNLLAAPAPFRRRREPWTLNLLVNDNDRRERHPKYFKTLFLLIRNPFTATPPLRFVVNRPRRTQLKCCPSPRHSFLRRRVPARQPCCLSIPPGLRPVALRPTLSGSLPFRALQIALRLFIQPRYIKQNRCQF